MIHIHFAIFYIGFFYGGRREDNWGGEDALEWVHKAIGGQFSHQISLTPVPTYLHTAAGKHNALNIWCGTICTLNVGFKIFRSALMHACREVSKGKYPSVKRYITQKQNCANHCLCFTVLLQSHQLVMSIWLCVHTTYLLLLHSIVGHTLEFLCSVMDILTLIV